MQIILGILVSVILYFPIVEFLSMPFIYRLKSSGQNATGGGAPWVIVTATLELIVGAIIIWRKPNNKNFGTGIIIGAVLMVLFMLFLTPALGI